MATKRGYYREELRRSIDNIEMALTHLARFIEAYDTAHSEYSEVIKTVGNALVDMAEVIQRTHDEI